MWKIAYEKGQLFSRTWRLIPEALEKSGVKGMGWSKTMKNRVSECP
jgi:hypothetical protein